MDLTLRLLRHGRTEWSDGGRYTGHADVGLTPEGRQALGRLALPAKDYTSVVCSDLRRCRETAEALGLEPRLDPALREFDFGSMEGMIWNELSEEMQAALLEYGHFVAPGGESVAAFETRVDRFVDGLGGGVHLLITHGGVINHLLRRHGSAQQVAPGEWVDLSVTRR